MIMNKLSQFLKKFAIVGMGFILPICPTFLYAKGLSYEGFWTNDINPDNTSRQIYVETVPPGPLYLCLRIKGEKDMFDMLQSNGSLPIQPTRHKWYRYIGTRPFFEEAQKPINIISLPTIEARPQDETPSEEPFSEWFMCSGKQQTRAGWWQVEIVYTNNEPVLCGKQPCIYKILVK